MYMTSVLSNLSNICAFPLIWDAPSLENASVSCFH
jgi:hypothetical protein